MSPVVELSAGSVSRGGRPILRDVDLVIQPGEAVAVLGANGSGKSTLVRNLLGLDPLTAGRLRLYGTPIRDFGAWERIGYVPQRSGAGGAVPASVREVVATGRLARRRPFLPMRAADHAAIRHALAVTDLTDRAEADVSTLSGGQQQRVLIARTLAGEPDLLVMDEPNAGVDHTNQQHIAASVATAMDAGATLIVVLHELGPFASIVDRALVLRSGRIAYDGPASAVVGAEPHAPHHAVDPTEPTLHDVRAPWDEVAP